MVRMAYRLSSPLPIALLIAACALGQLAAGLQYKIRVRNLTYQQPFSQIGVFAHTWDFATDGDVSPYLCGYSVGSSTQLLPGETERLTLVVDETICPDGALFSMMAMMANTNDAFVGIDSAEMMTTSSSKLYPPAFDAGTEENTELCIHIPGPACSATSGNEEAEPGEGYVHIHRGIYGIGELSPEEHDWKNPVAEVFIAEPTLV